MNSYRNKNNQEGVEGFRKVESSEKLRGIITRLANTWTPGVL